mmetsp:Transcript_127484/g.356986  ORF Transcript_127484/g.356986 Transcript_127484/m.356986 type:complete len:225 (-) Transcript_127484:47-721(-)
MLVEAKGNPDAVNKKRETPTALARALIDGGETYGRSWQEVLSKGKFDFPVAFGVSPRQAAGLVSPKGSNVLSPTTKSRVRHTNEHGLLGLPTTSGTQRLFFSPKSPPRAEDDPPSLQIPGSAPPALHVGAPAPSSAPRPSSGGSHGTRPLGVGPLPGIKSLSRDGAPISSGRSTSNLHASPAQTAFKTAGRSPSKSSLASQKSAQSAGGGVRLPSLAHGRAGGR